MTPQLQPSKDLSETGGNIIIYTDGGCNNGVASSKIPDRVGAWAFVQVSKDPIVNCQYVVDTTNNRTEMLAVINAIKSIQPNQHATIYSDSGYVVNGWNNPSYLEKWMANGWKTSANKPVENQDLWEDLIIVADSLSRFKSASFELRLIKGHGKNDNPEHNEWNTLVDKACTHIMIDEWHKKLGEIKLRPITKKSFIFQF